MLWCNVKTIAEIDAALMEAEQIRSRHDGVHSVHSCVAMLELIRGLMEMGAWRETAETAFDETMRRLRRIDRTGFDPDRDPFYPRPHEPAQATSRLTSAHSPHRPHHALT
jgi:hypothetical protein